MPRSHKALNGNPFKIVTQGVKPGSAAVLKTAPFGIAGSSTFLGKRCTKNWCAKKVEQILLSAIFFKNRRF